MLALLTQQLRAESSPGDVHEVLFEVLCVFLVISRAFHELLVRLGHGLAVAADHGLRVHEALQQLLRFSAQLARQHGDSGGAVAHLFVLGFRNI